VLLQTNSTTSKDAGEVQEIAIPLGIIWSELYLVQHRKQLLAMQNTTFKVPDKM
jgi:hypothetical protein